MLRELQAALAASLLSLAPGAGVSAEESTNLDVATNLLLSPELRTRRGARRGGLGSPLGGAQAQARRSLLRVRGPRPARIGAGFAAPAAALRGEDRTRCARLGRPHVGGGRGAHAARAGCAQRRPRRRQPRALRPARAPRAARSGSRSCSPTPSGRWARAICAAPVARSTARSSSSRARSTPIACSTRSTSAPGAPKWTRPRTRRSTDTSRPGRSSSPRRYSSTTSSARKRSGPHDSGGAELARATAAYRGGDRESALDAFQELAQGDDAAARNAAQALADPQREPGRSARSGGDALPNAACARLDGRRRARCRRPCPRAPRRSGSRATGTDCGRAHCVRGAGRSGSRISRSTRPRACGARGSPREWRCTAPPSATSHGTPTASAHPTRPEWLESLGEQQRKDPRVAPFHDGVLVLPHARTAFDRLSASRVVVSREAFETATPELVRQDRKRRRRRVRPVARHRTASRGGDRVHALAHGVARAARTAGVGARAGDTGSAAAPRGRVSWLCCVASTRVCAAVACWSRARGRRTARPGSTPSEPRSWTASARERSAPSSSSADARRSIAERELGGSTSFCPLETTCIDASREGDPVFYARATRTARSASGRARTSANAQISLEVGMSGPHASLVLPFARWLGIAHLLPRRGARRVGLDGISAGPRRDDAGRRRAADPSSSRAARAAPSSSRSTTSGRAFSPIRPIRQMRPASLPSPPPDLDPVLVEQPRAAAAPRRDRREHGVQHRQAVRRRDQHAEAERLEPRDQPRRARRGGARSAPRALRRARARAPRAARRSSRSARCGGRRASRRSSGRSARGRGTSSAPARARRSSRASARAPNASGDSPGGQRETFLCTRVGGVDLPLVEAHVHAGERGHAVEPAPARPRARAARAISAIGCATPVEVSACTSATSAGRRASISAMKRSGGTISPISASTRSTRAPARSRDRRACARRTRRSPPTSSASRPARAGSPGTPPCRRCPCPRAATRRPTRSCAEHGAGGAAASSSSARNAGIEVTDERAGEGARALRRRRCSDRDRGEAAREAKPRSWREYTGAPPAEDAMDPQLSLLQDRRAKELPAKIVFENERLVAFEDIAPAAPTHVHADPARALRVHARGRSEPPRGRGRARRRSRRSSRASAASPSDGYRLVFNTNAAAGQTVFHLHLHLLGGRTFRWPPG